MTDQPNDRKSLWMLISAMVIWGTIGVFRRYIPLSSAFLACSRGILGGLFLLILTRVRGRASGARLPRRTAVRLAVTGAMIGLNWMLLFEAYNHTTVAVATLCYYMQPTIVMLLSPLIFREPLTKRKAVCAALSVLGMVLVSGVIGEGGAGNGDFRGVLLGLAAAALYAGVVIANKRVRGIDPTRRTTVELLAAGVVMLPYVLLTDSAAGGTVGIPEVLLLAVLGIVHTGIAYALYFGSMEGLRVQTIAVFSYIDPISALLFSAVLLREPLSPLNIAGAVLIIGSAAAAEWGDN